GSDIDSDNCFDFYRREIENMAPGVTEIVIHPGLDDPELRAFAADRPSFGAEWRQRDFDFFTSDGLRNMLAKNNIRLVNWRELISQLQRVEANRQSSDPVTDGRVH